MFDKIKQLNELKRKAKIMEETLAAEVLEVSYRGIVIQISAGLDVKSIVSDNHSDEDIKDAINKAIKEAQKVQAQKMRGQMGDLGLNIPGL